MKKYITIVQLNELSEKGKNKLREWWKPEYGDKFIAPLRFNYTVIYTGEGYVPKDIIKDKITFPLLSIGQMIEFLEEQRKFPPIKVLIANEATMMKDGHVDSKDTRYWCDYLWEAIKQILEK